MLIHFRFVEHFDNFNKYLEETALKVLNSDFVVIDSSEPKTKCYGNFLA